MSGDDEFVVEDVETIIKQALQGTFSADTVYDPEKVNAWTNTMVEQSLRGLQGQSKPFKYVVTAIIVQKNGAGLHTAAGTFWDGKRDGACPCRWFAARTQQRGCSPPLLFPPFPPRSPIARARPSYPPPPLRPAHPLGAGVCKVPWENGTMQVIVTVFALSVNPSPQAVGPPAAV